MGILDSMMGIASSLGGFGGGMFDDDEDDNPIKNILGMGDINKDLRQMALGPLLGGLFGGGQKEPENLPPGTISETGAMPQAQTMAQNILNPGRIQTESMTPNAPFLNGAGNGSAAQGQDITVTGDGWQPRKPTILGAIADAYLEANGMEPAYAINRDARNVNEAMGDYVNDPESALKRLSMIRGHENDVTRLKNQYDDNARADRVEERQFGNAQDRARKNLAGMLSAVRSSKDPAAAYNANLAFMRNYAEQNKLDPSLLPDTYDEDKINFGMTQGVPVDDQMKMAALEEHRRQQRDLGRDKLDETVRYHDERLKDFDNQEAGRNARDNGPTLKSRLGGRAYKDNNGSLVEFNGEGNAMKVTSKDGKFINMFKIGPDGRPVHVKRMSAEEYAQALAAKKAQ